MTATFPDSTLLVKLALNIGMIWLKSIYQADVRNKHRNQVSYIYWYVCDQHLYTELPLRNHGGTLQSIYAGINTHLITPQVERKKKVMLRKATKVHMYLQCFSLSFCKPERTS